MNADGPAPTPGAEEWPATTRERFRQGGFLLVDKPRGPSSHQVTAWVRNLLGREKAGHAGTLDPNVSGLLWVGFGPALKLIPLVLEFPKRYIAAVGLHGTVTERDLARVLREFTGPVYQTPPVRSAVKRERRVRTIHRLDLVETDGTRLLLDVTADSGTYVRSLAVDLGEALGVGGNLEELRRTGTGPFTERDVIALAAIADAAEEARAGRPDRLERLIHPLEEVWQAFPRILVKEAAASALAHGADLAAGGVVSVPRPFARGDTVVLVTRTEELLALGRALVGSDELAVPRKGWVVDAERVFVDAARFPKSWRSTASAAPSKEAGGR